MQECALNTKAFGQQYHQNNNNNNIGREINEPSYGTRSTKQRRHNSDNNRTTHSIKKEREGV